MLWWVAASRRLDSWTEAEPVVLGGDIAPEDSLTRTVNSTARTVSAFLPLLSSVQSNVETGSE